MRKNQETRVKAIFSPYFSLTNWLVCIIIETWGINMRLFLHTFALLQVLTPICNMWVDICVNITSSEVRQISHPSLPAFRDKLVCGRVQLNANNPRWLRAPSAAFLSVRAWSIICPRNHHHFYMPPPCSSNLIKPLFGGFLLSHWWVVEINPLLPVLCVISRGENWVLRLQ